MRCKIFKKAVCMTMAILMLCVSINAQELQTNPDSEVITPRYSYTDDAYADLSIRILFGFSNGDISFL